MLILRPTPEPTATRGSAWQSGGPLVARSLGFLINGKPNVDRLLESVRASLESGPGAFAVPIVVTKPSASVPADAAMLRKLSHEADVAVVGVGD